MGDAMFPFGIFAQITYTLIRMGGVRADALGSVLQVHVGRFWGPLGWDTFLVSDLGWETGFGLLSPS